eukprot:566385-Rhodomonas_salina.1
MSELNVEGLRRLSSSSSRLGIRAERSTRMRPRRSFLKSLQISNHHALPEQRRNANRFSLVDQDGFTPNSVGKYRGSR